ncbi:MAG: chromosomal replication initiation protein DnaA [Cyanobacteria bacterium RYN_339]|nr:chromosomal replication initiation protein DnaA [Cyanobacteria bacterium RYN_339]
MPPPIRSTPAFMSVDELWQQALVRIEAHLGSTPQYKTMFETSRLIDRQGNQVLIEVPNKFMLDQMRKNHHDMLIRDVLASLDGTTYNVEFVVPAGGAVATATRPMSAPVPTPAPRPVGPTPPVMGILNPKYTFESFVIGSHSHFAHAASMAVAESPAKAYNPLFIYGGVGLGKTHLMHAIAQHMLANHPEMKVAYLSSEKFTNELVTSIKDGRMLDFKNRYRTIDLLLIDDIQFIEGKESTQEEFFHTFNALHESGKQIVMTSDRPPKEIAALEARLRSRFEWGLICDIQSPDLETRIAILKKKAEVDNIYAPDEVLAYIAASYPNNVRELEGAFIRVMAYASLGNQQVTEGLARQALGNIRPPRQITVATITEAVAELYHLEVADLVGSRRTKDISLARQVAMYIARDLTDMSLNVIGSKFGGRDHTTVMHAIDKIKTQVAKDTQLSAEVQKITTKLQAGG